MKLKEKVNEIGASEGVGVYLRMQVQWGFRDLNFLSEEERLMALFLSASLRHVAVMNVG